MRKTTNGAGGFAPREVGPEGAAPKGQHTPGPWTVAIPIELTFPDDKARQESAYEIQTEDGGATLCYTVGTDADTRLIAAAPDLLAALREMLESYAPWAQREVDRQGEGCLHPAVRAARAAIARATGGDK